MEAVQMYLSGRGNATVEPIAGHCLRPRGLSSV